MQKLPKKKKRKAIEITENIVSFPPSEDFINQSVFCNTLERDTYTIRTPDCTWGQQIMSLLQSIWKVKYIRLCETQMAITTVYM